MAKKMGGGNTYTGKLPKKTRQGKSNLTKRGKRGGGPNGSTTSKSYKKRYRGQGK
jgi:hypothetical protein|tara:strand:- start:2152 stop:2316 length:165 start_codon:yes stop_codon:yes gene_type:complete